MCNISQEKSHWCTCTYDYIDSIDCFKVSYFHFWVPNPIVVSYIKNGVLQIGILMIRIMKYACDSCVLSHGISIGRVLCIIGVVWAYFMAYRIISIGNFIALRWYAMTALNWQHFYKHLLTLINWQGAANEATANSQVVGPVFPTEYDSMDVSLWMDIIRAYVLESWNTIKWHIFGKSSDVKYSLSPIK